MPHGAYFGVKMFRDGFRFPLIESGQFGASAFINAQ
jgi:hypothetical protein